MTLARAIARRLALPAAVVACVAIVATPAPAGSSEHAALERAKERIRSIGRELDAARDAEAGAQASLRDAEARLAELERIVNEVAAAVERQEVAVREAATELVRLEERAAELRTTFETRAADIYKNGSGIPFEVVLASGDVDQAIERSAFIRVITRADRASLEEVQAGQVAVAAQRELLDAERQRLEQMQVEQEALRAEAERLRDSKALAAAAARQRVARLDEQQDELEEHAEELEELIRRNRATPVMASAPSTAGYVWPVCARVTSEYGRRWGRMHRGVDVDGSTGDPIGAAKEGVVIFAGWQGGYGRLTLIDHGDGVVTAYAHQSSQRVAAGQRVVRGERIGAVGNTGRSTGSHLHFETRVNGAAVNPRRFLPGGC